MVIKSVPIDDMNTVVFAIRGSQTFMDWAVNLNSAPASPNGFLVTHLPPDLNGDADEPQDDPGNLCHSGFLSVARKMVKPVAARLRSMLEEDPSRAGCSLLITGHSAGGAVASLLYAHMLAKEVKSELNILTGCTSISSSLSKTSASTDHHSRRLQTCPLHHLRRSSHLPPPYRKTTTRRPPQIPLPLLHQRRRSRSPRRQSLRPLPSRPLRLPQPWFLLRPHPLMSYPR